MTGSLTGNISFLIGLIILIGVVETVIPMRAVISRDHWFPNISLITIFFIMNIVFSLLLIDALLFAERSNFGLLYLIEMPDWLRFVAGFVLLDFMTWIAHKTMHLVPGFWNFHRVHHSANFLDATVCFRQHPFETVLRFTFTLVPALLLGVVPAAYAVYRLTSGSFAPMEHANLAIPERIDRVLRMVFVTPNVHKFHHDRAAAMNETNFGNIFSVWDRLFGCFTPPVNMADIRFGLDGFDSREDQSLAGLLRMPFREFSAAPPASAGAGDD